MKSWSSPFHVQRCQVPPRARFTFTSSTTRPPVLQSLSLLFHVKRSKVFPRPRFLFNSSTILTFIDTTFNQIAIRHTIHPLLFHVKRNQALP